jgi:predicted branched-subunit amino acid permease
MLLFDPTNGRPMTLHSTSFSSEIRRGLTDALPVLLGFVPFALVLGAQAVEKGFALLEVPMMTGLNFGGGSEFAALGLWASPPEIALIVAVTFLVNSRHLLMGAALAPFLRHLPPRIALPSLFLMCDEAWAMSLADARQSGRFSLPYYLAVGGSLWLTWVIFTGVGAVAGPVLGDVTRFGLDMAFAAVFFVMLRGMWQGWRAARPWAASLIAAGATDHLLPGAWYVPVGMAAGLAAATLQANKT